MPAAPTRRRDSSYWDLVNENVPPDTGPVHEFVPA
jgi:hypothetical protein